MTGEGNGYVNTVKYIKCTYENIKEFIKNIVKKEHSFHFLIIEQNHKLFWLGVHIVTVNISKRSK